MFEFDRAVRDFQALLDADPSDHQWSRRLADAQAMRDMTHYQVLSVPHDCDAAVMKKAYRTQCLRWHPDKHTACDEDQQRANTAFRRINEAYDVLSDSYKRMVYDMEKRPVLLSQRRAGTDADGFDQWFRKEQSREAERTKERLQALEMQQQLDTHMEAQRKAVKQRRLDFERQQQLQQERER